MVYFSKSVFQHSPGSVQAALGVRKNGQFVFVLCRLDFHGKDQRLLSVEEAFFLQDFQVVVKLRNVICAVGIAETLMKVAVAFRRRICDGIAEVQVCDVRTAGADYILRGLIADREVGKVNKKAEVGAEGAYVCCELGCQRSRADEGCLVDVIVEYLELYVHVLLCSGADGEYLYSYEGAWSLTLVPDEMDRLTLLFTATDHPAYEGSGYSAECGYSVYAEGWVEEDVEHTYLILEDEAASGVSPFQDILGEAGGWPIGMHREEGPNMRVAHCKSFVSLREERSVSSARLAKVPLGAEVLAFTRYGEENGFLLCVYHGEYGYILSEYLEPIE